MFKKDEKKKSEEVKKGSKEPEKKVDTPEEGGTAHKDEKQDPGSEPSQSSQPSQESEKKGSAPQEPDWKTLYALTLADFDNYKKRAARDREDVYRYAESDILKDVLPAVDNLALALANAKQTDAAVHVDTAANVDAGSRVDAASLPRENDNATTAFDSFVQGVQLVYDTLLKSLKDHGAEPFDSVGQTLDIARMEAIATLPSDTVEEGKVSIESKKGWMLKDKVLRAAQVVVSSGKPQ